MCRLLISPTILFLISFQACAQFVADYASSDNLHDLSESAASWGDYDRDGDLDLVIMGGAGTEFVEIYRNDEGTLTQTDINLPPISQGSVMWGDFDGDGDPDILIAGLMRGGIQPGITHTSVTLVMRNDNGTFTDHQAGLKGVSNSVVRWGDFDQDNQLDIAFIGSVDTENTNDILKVYHNNGGTFAEVPLPIQPSAFNLHGSVSWGDFDMDEDLDLLITGLGPNSAGDNLVTMILENKNGTFEDAGIPLQGVAVGSGEWGDFNNDGKLDLAISGQRLDGSFVTVIYKNNAGTFSEIAANINPVSYGQLTWNDYDKDNDLDLMLNGISNATFLPVTMLIENQTGSFQEIDTPLPGIWGKAAWGDYDKDSDEDILLTGLNENLNECTLLFRNVPFPNQEIAVQIPQKSYGDENFDIVVTASSGLPVTLEKISGPVMLTDNTISIYGAGEVILSATQTGNGSVNAAPATSIEFFVHKAPLRVIAENKSSTYGNKLPELTYNYERFINGDDASVLLEKPTIVTTASETSNVGTYPITIEGGLANNYDINGVEGLLTITKATAKITLLDTEQFFDGSPKEVLVETIPEGLKATVTYNDNSEIPFEAGSYNVIAVVDNPNYQGNTSGTLLIQLISSINNRETPFKLVLFPMPADTKINIHGLKSMANEICIYNLSGQVVAKQALMNQTSINISNLVMGIYILEVTDRNGVRYKQKILIK